MMNEENQTSRYVKLTKAQITSTEEEHESSQPGELNQAIPTSQLHVRKCNECGQVLPQSYQAPANEPWSSGIFGCREDTNTCWTGFFCPCVLFGKNIERIRDDEDVPWIRPCICHAICVEGGMALAAVTALTYGIDPETTCLIWEGLLFAWWISGICAGNARQALQRKYHLKNSPCDPCLVHCCMHWCAICQEHREMKSRLSNEPAMSSTILNPPPIQAMDNHNEPTVTSTSTSTSTSNGKANVNNGPTLEMQPL